ncbi:hypothetical protein GCM10009696_00670 [Kocuria himachalensis]
MGLSKNPKVTWNTPQAESEGTTVDKRTEEFDLDAHTHRAGGEDPRYIVESDSSGARAAHQGNRSPRPGPSPRACNGPGPVKESRGRCTVVQRCGCGCGYLGSSAAFMAASSTLSPACLA